MDLIAGLPEDTVESFEYSLSKAISMNPENITVHTLALKRSSNLVTDKKERDGFLNQLLDDWYNNKISKYGSLSAYNF